MIVLQTYSVLRSITPDTPTSILNQRWSIANLLVSFRTRGIKELSFLMAT